MTLWVITVVARSHFWRKMFKRFVALLLITGACSAYPHDAESTIGPLPPTEGFVDPPRRDSGNLDPERGPVDPERGPVNPDRVHLETIPLYPERSPVDSEETVDPEKGPISGQNVPDPAEVPEDFSAPQHDPKPEGDLKTDATFWWPFYRSFWGYPSYTRRTYWTYPHYRYYRPRSYYRYYYW